MSSSIIFLSNISNADTVLINGYLTSRSERAIYKTMMPAFLVLSNGDSIEYEHISIIIFQSSHFPSPSMSLYLYKTTHENLVLLV